MNTDGYEIMFRVTATVGEDKIATHDGIGRILKLPVNKELIVGFDQSTEQTGIAIATRDGKLIAMVDCINLGLANKEVYKALLRKFIRNQFQDTVISHTVFEIPVENNQKNTYSRNRLIELEGFMKGLQVDIDEFGSAEFDSIPISLWRHSYLASKEYDGLRRDTADAKRSAMLETIKRFPEFRQYCTILGIKKDSCDAVGILFGYREEAFFDKDMKVRRVSKVMPEIFSTGYQSKVVKGKLCDMKQIIKDSFGALGYNRSFVPLIYNESISIDSNCLRCASWTNKICILSVITPKAADVFRWEHADLVLEPGEFYMVLVYRNNITNRVSVCTRVGEEEFWLK